MTTPPSKEPAKPSENNSPPDYSSSITICLCGLLLFAVFVRYLQSDSVMKEPVVSSLLPQASLPPQAVDFQKMMEDKLRAELERRGEFRGSEWSSLFLNLSDSYLGEWVPETVQLGDGAVKTYTANKAVFSATTLFKFDDDGFVRHWSVSCSFEAASHTFGAADNPTEWSQGNGTLRGHTSNFFATRTSDGTANGTVVSYTLSSRKSSGETVDFENAVDSLLRNYEHPKDPQSPGRLAMTSCMIRSKRIEFDNGAGNLPHRVIGEIIADRQSQIEISKCPLDFQVAYREHIAAWKKANESEVARTWEKVKEVARRHRVGTLFIF